MIEAFVVFRVFSFEFWQIFKLHFCDYDNFMKFTQIYDVCAIQWMLKIFKNIMLHSHEVIISCVWIDKFIFRFPFEYLFEDCHFSTFRLPFLVDIHFIITLLHLVIIHIHFIIIFIHFIIISINFIIIFIHLITIPIHLKVIPIWASRENYCFNIEKEFFCFSKFLIGFLKKILKWQFD